MKPRFIVQMQSKPGGRWNPVDSFDIASVAIEVAGRTNRPFKFGEAVHRVWDDNQGKEIYRRGMVLHKTDDSSPLEGSQ